MNAVNTCSTSTTSEKFKVFKENANTMIIVFFLDAKVTLIASMMVFSTAKDLAFLSLSDSTCMQRQLDYIQDKNLIGLLNSEFDAL